MACEPAMTNVCTNPSFEVDLAGWSDYGVVTRTRVTTGAKSGSASMRIQTANAAFAGSRILFDPVIGVYAISFYIKGAVNDSVRITAFNGFTTTLTTTATVTSADWQRLSLLGTIDQENTIHLYIDTGGNAQTVDWLIDAVQIENRALPSRYFDGSLGHGYAWTGTANASTSTRAAYIDCYGGGNGKGRYFAQQLRPKAST